ncbi:BlaI/MecI/CopY family transcriptional regulator [Propioniciclava soli]|uniref:BlaI/MecI/CopY family transcriptional regulator n=1 Tax=Propioniciclava soli TaxID=2775081 RepID=A0ABZ3C7A2_9ACTN
MSILGELEQAVMDALWRRSAPTSVRDVHAELAAQREIAYTTVMTVLDRLAKKGIVVRQLDGRAWFYEPAHSRVELHARAIEDILGDLPLDVRHAVWERLRAGDSAD